MGKTAFIFPGQGSQSVGMGKDLYENYTISKNIFDKANEILSKDLSNLCFNGPDEDLKLTINTQPAIVTTSIAALEALKEKCSITPAFVAGHSLGEFVAMYEAGVLNLESALKIIAKRAELMNKAASTTSGTMAAVLGLSKDKIEECVNEASKNGIVSVANYNSPDQTVITGEIDAVKEATELLTQAEAKRVIPLAVSGAFHSPLMKDTSIEFANYINGFDVQNASITVITNTDANPTINKEEFLEKMPKQIYSSVYWTQTIEYMIGNGVDTFIEIGPGKVLAGLNKKINQNIKTYNIFDSASLNTTIEALKTTQTI